MIMIVYTLFQNIYLDDISLLKIHENS
jgi:hypothetical protein